MTTRDKNPNIWKPLQILALKDISHNIPKTFVEMMENVIYLPLKETYPAVDIMFKQKNKLYGINVTREKKKKGFEVSAIALWLSELKLENDVEVHVAVVATPQNAFDIRVTLEKNSKLVKVLIPRGNKDSSNDGNKWQEDPTNSDGRVISFSVWKLPDDYSRNAPART